MLPNLILGIDFGGTKNSIALTRRGASSWLGHHQRISLPFATAKKDIDTCLELASDLLSRHQGRLLAVGVSFGGPVDFDKGIVLKSYHVDGWEDFPLQKFLEQEFNVATILDNDANAGAMGEWQFGAGTLMNSLLYITVSTGIGGGWVLNGNLHRGFNNLAGEIGHLMVDTSGPRCACGRSGCLESVASGPAIARQAVCKMEANKNSGKILQELCDGDLSKVSAELVNQAAIEGDKLSIRVFQDAARYLGYGIGQALTLMNPERVILGGGVSKAGEFFWNEVKRTAMIHVPEGTSVDIVPALLRDDAPLWGAIALADQNLIC